MALAIKAQVRDQQAKTFVFNRQATNKIVGISDEAAAFLRKFL